MPRFLLVPLVLGGCGRGSYSTSLPGDTTLASLDDTQICQLQEERYDYMEKAFSEADACCFGAQFAAALASAFDPSVDWTESCEQAFDECMAEDADPEPFECFEFVVPEGCPYTVDEFVTCQNEVFDALFDLIAFKCREFDPEEESYAPSPTCDAIQDECGVFFL